MVEGSIPAPAVRTGSVVAVAPNHYEKKQELIGQLACLMEGSTPNLQATSALSPRARQGLTDIYERKQYLEDQPPAKPGEKPIDRSYTSAIRYVINQISFEFGPKSGDEKREVWSIETKNSILLELINAHDAIECPQPSTPTSSLMPNRGTVA